MTNLNDMTLQQKNYLEGFVTGINANRQAKGQPTITQSLTIGGKTIATDITNAHESSTEMDLHRKAQDRFLAAGQKLSNEENAKRKTNGMDIWEQMRAAASEGQFPKGTDVFLYKFQGMFYVSPAQNSFMCRMRFPGGLLNAHQIKGIADLADQYAGGYTHVTTRANFQIREIKPADPVHVLTGLADLGVIIRGSGGDNVRNITASPTAGIDSQELIDTRSLA
ncbi:NirA family protein, partial [bacterium AH-315-I18]|nr:NirA family protein [bacterium AH-315-I18]